MHPGSAAASTAPTPRALSHRPTPADPFQVFQVRLNTAASVRRSENSVARREPLQALDASRVQAGSITIRATPPSKSNCGASLAERRIGTSTLGHLRRRKPDLPEAERPRGAIFPQRTPVARRSGAGLG